VIEGNKGIDQFPNFPVLSVKNMGAVDVNIDAVSILAIDIPAPVGAFFDDQNAFSRPSGLVRENGTKETGTYNKIIVFHEPFPPEAARESTVSTWGLKNRPAAAARITIKNSRER
jgi:hypothetical protein